MTRRHDGLAFIWEFPLAVGSFVFFKSVKTVMRRLLRMHQARSIAENRGWQIMSSDFVAKPGIVPLVMATGPRWNTHAVIGMLASGTVKESLEIDVEAANRSARSWTIVVWTHPDQRTVTSVGSLSPPFSDGKARLKLSPGQYWLGLRYYQWNRDAELPAVWVDGKQVGKAVVVPANVNDFYRDLRNRSSIYYRALHYYVFVLLRYQRWFSPSFVAREFLPVGNPETEFYFEAVRKGECLQIHVAQPALDGWDIFLTLYDRASFPTNSEQVTQPYYEIAARDGDRMCLVRLQRRVAGKSEYRREWVELALADPEARSQRTGTA